MPIICLRVSLCNIGLHVSLCNIGLHISLCNVGLHVSLCNIGLHVSLFRIPAYVFLFPKSILLVVVFRVLMFLAYYARVVCPMFSECLFLAIVFFMRTEYI